MMYIGLSSFFLRLSHTNAITQMITETSEPVAVAIPIGRRVFGNILDVMYTPGILIRTMAVILCKKESSDLSQAQKYPLKLK